jgi:D-serine/D-alanine/glycine transporter
MKEHKPELERGLSNRHLQLIAIGGAIGTGLFLGSGKSISLAGPSILFAYMITGGIVFLIMRALGEILLSDLSFHSFVDFTKEYLGERFAFLVGWTYWFCWVCIAMADLTAVGLYVQYWAPEVPSWMPGLIALIILLVLNLLTVKLFGEVEFWFALIKIVAIIALIIVGLYLIMTGLQYQIAGGSTIKASFTNLWDRGGWFPNGFGNFLLSFQLVTFAFVGVELVGLTAGETADPMKSLPKAINNIPVRILIFYIGALTVIMAIYPWDTVNPEESPFVNVFKAAGIASAAGIVNFVVLTSAASACNSAVFSTSRMLYSLAKDDSAPKVLATVSRHKVPNHALGFSTLIIAIALVLNYIMPNASEVFLIVSGVSTVCFIFIWATIIVSHLVYRKRRPDLAEKNIFKMPFYPISNIVVLGFLACVVIILAFIPETQIALLFTPLWFVLLTVMYHFTKKQKDTEDRLLIENK